jgi:hypothetical protein
MRAAGLLVLVVLGCAPPPSIMAPPPHRPKPLSEWARATAPERVREAALAAAADEEIERIASAELLADLAVLEQAFRALHPDLFRHRTPAEVEAIFASGKRTFAAPRTLREAFAELARLTARLGVRHAGPSLTAQPREIAEAVIDVPRLPFRFRWVEDQMIVDGGFVGAVRAPVLIQRIDGREPSSMLYALARMTPADDERYDRRIALLGNGGDRAPARFDVLAPLVFPVLDDGTVVIEFRGDEGPVRTELSALPAARSHAAAGVDQWSFERPAPRAALVRMPTWAVADPDWDWNGALAGTIERARASRARVLIVDLRGNRGDAAGVAAGDALLAHLIRRPIQVRDLDRRVWFETIPEELRPFVELPDPALADLAADATPIEGGWRRLDTAPITVAPRSPRFRGRVTVLVDAATGGAALRFAALVQRHRLGRVIDSTGARPRDSDGDATAVLRLPNSHIAIDLPVVATFTPMFFPDVVLVPSHADVLAGRDRALDFALKH